MTLEKHSPYQRGYNNTVSTFFVAKENRNQEIELNQSWLPLSDDEDQLALLHQYRAPDVCLTMQDRDYIVLKSYLEHYALERGWLNQGFFLQVRPKAFDDLERQHGLENPKKADLARIYRQLITVDRPIIEIQHPNEKNQIIHDLISICKEYLEKESKDHHYLENTHAHTALTRALKENPFLVYCIMKELPKLAFFSYMGEIADMPCAIRVLRPHLLKINIDEDWLIQNPVIRLRQPELK